VTRVTDQRAAARSAGSRNAAILAEAEARRDRPITAAIRRASALLGGSGDDEIRQGWYDGHLERSTYACQDCGRVFEEGDLVARYRSTEWHAQGWHLRSICAECAGAKGDEETIPCAGGCGVLVASFVRRDYMPREDSEWLRYKACSSRCAKNARRLARQPEPRFCAECGEPFVPTRSDGRYCKSACRQRAYRRRKGEAS
jgi:hypothetical protein